MRLLHKRRRPAARVCAYLAAGVPQDGITPVRLRNAPRSAVALKKRIT